MIRIQQLRLSLDENITDLQGKIIKRLQIPKEDLLSWHIFKESVDARKESDLHFTYCVDCELKKEAVVLKHFKKDRDIGITPDYHYSMPQIGNSPLQHRPIVVGFGPAGMFASLLLAQCGFRPLVIERGGCVEERVKSVEAFWEEGILDTQCNVQFGEGGAGTFSDGKLTTRVKDYRVHKILEELVRFGAPKEILYEAHPHIGTDLLRNIVANIRREVIRLGGEVRFHALLEDILIENDQVNAVVVNGKRIACDQLILAIGHSARDTMRMLLDQHVHMVPKPFAVGARIEHPQELINKAQYKSHYGHPRLGAAEYRLTHTASNGRGVYTFCMCPGGYVVASTSMEHGVVVNGMSEHARNGVNANSAILVQVGVEDYGNDCEKAIAYQEEIERKAYIAGGSNYHAPIQRVQDFLHHQPSTHIGSVRSTYALGVTPCDLHDVLPDYICSSLEEGIIAFDRKIHGFAMDDALLTGVETRSSSPVRIERRKEDCISLSTEGLYPCGEGAGYAGGIVSAAIDGIRCAEKIVEAFYLEDEEK